FYVDVTWEASDLEAGKPPNNNQQSAYYDNERAEQDQVTTNRRQSIWHRNRSRTAGLGLSCLAEELGDASSNLGGAFDDMDSRRLKGSHLFVGGALAASDDRAGMAHPPARRGSLTPNESYNWLAHVAADKIRRFFFGSSPNLPDHHDSSRV